MTDEETEPNTNSTSWVLSHL